MVTGAPLIYATSQFQDHTEIGFDDCPPTPGDDDDDDDDKDKVSGICALPKQYKTINCTTGDFSREKQKHYMFVS